MRKTPDVPSWLVGLLSGLFYGVAFGLGVRYLAPVGWTTAVIAGAVGGPLFGLMMFAVAEKTNHFLKPAAGLTREQNVAALRAAQWGPVPTDPVIRAAALVFAQRQLKWIGATWIRVLLGFVLLSAVLSLVLDILDDDRGWWPLIPRVGTVLVLGFFAFQPSLLRRRVKALSADGAD
ncbi:hypothetical protein [Kribbella endophytica]